MLTKKSSSVLFRSELNSECAYSEISFRKRVRESMDSYQPRWRWSRRTPPRWRRSWRPRRRRRRRTSRSCSELASHPSRSSRAAARTGGRRTCAASCRTPPAAPRPFPSGARAGAAGDGRWPSRRRSGRPPRRRRSAGGPPRWWSPSLGALGCNFHGRNVRKRREKHQKQRNRALRLGSISDAS